MLLDAYVFSDISVDNSDLHQYAVENNYYTFNTNNIIKILNRVDKKEQLKYSFEELFVAINQEQLECLKLNLEKHRHLFNEECLNDFLHENKMSSEALVYLLETLSVDNQDKEKVLETVDSSSKVNDINDVSVDAYQSLVKSDHLEPTFCNIYSYIDDIGYDEPIERHMLKYREEFLNAETDLNEKRDYFVTILKSTRNDKMIKLIKQIIGELELVLNEFSSDINHLINLLKYGLNFVVDENSKENLIDNEELFYQYLKNYYHENLFEEINVFIAPQISSNLYQSNIISFDEFFNLAKWQIEKYDSQEEYLMKVSLNLDNNKFVVLLDRVNLKEEKLAFLHAYISSRDYSRDFVLDTLVEIDDEYSVFKTKPHFVVYNSNNLKSVLDEIKGEIITKYNEQDNGNIHVYMKRKGIFN